MQNPTTFKRHAALVDDMATVQGLDLEELMLRGKMTFTDLENAVLSCTGCSQPCSCETWLAEPRSTPAPSTPDYCRNASLFRELRDV